jgi:enoyl-CoA hydratase/carnithine racemase
MTSASEAPVRSFETILLEKTPDKVATITINRPEALNAFTRRMCEEFRELWRELAEDEDVNAIVLRAAAGRAFSTGMDVHNAGKHLGSDQLWNKRDPGELLGPKFNHCWKPLIVAVHGMCAGGAFYWLNEGDIVICSEDAEFFDPHVTYGMTAALEPIGMRWRIALPEVLRMALMGNDERIGAQTALRISLVTEVTPRDQLWPRAHEIAATIAAKPSVATQGTIRAVWESLDATRTASLTTALKYTLLGNPAGIPQVSREALMKTKKTYRVR